jgi:hypothetical protein
VGAESAFDGAALKRSTLLVNKGFCTNDDPRSAESALERTCGSECIGVSIPLDVIEALEGRDGLSLRLLEGDKATRHRLAVNKHGAGATLTRRGAAVLWTCHS